MAEREERIVRVVRHVRSCRADALHRRGKLERQLPGRAPHGRTRCRATPRRSRRNRRGARRLPPRSRGSRPRGRGRCRRRSAPAARPRAATRCSSASKSRPPAWKRPSRKLPSARLVRRLDPHERDVGVLQPVDDRAGAAARVASSPRQVDAGGASQREDVAAVGEEHERPASAPRRPRATNSGRPTIPSAAAPAST